jgi:hypothetical protein
MRPNRPAMAYLPGSEMMMMMMVVVVVMVINSILHLRHMKFKQ